MRFDSLHRLFHLVHLLITFAKKMPVTSIPKFPIVDPSPKLDKTLANLSLIDYTKIGAFSAAGYVFGWFSGKTIIYPTKQNLPNLILPTGLVSLNTARKPFRGQQSKFLAGVGLFAGITYATLSSAQRFMGLEANASEVQRYGVMSADEVARRTEQMNTPNLVLIDSAANHDD